MTSSVKLSVNKTVSGSLNVTIDDLTSGTRILGGKGNGSYQTVESFSLDNEKIDEIIDVLKKYKRSLKKVKKV